MSHLLIDRFRFDSFAPDSDEAGSNLLTRFGQIVYLFFLVTPPAALVERAWNRGLDVGRYKAVDDTLAHAVEAYAGMPELFFTWVRRADKRVHFEFLDNSVARGEPPRTAAFGWNDVLNVLDAECLFDIERFRQARHQCAVPRRAIHGRRSVGARGQRRVPAQCLSEFREVNFAEQGTGQVYLQMPAERVNGSTGRHLALVPGVARRLTLLPAMATRPAIPLSRRRRADAHRRHVENATRYLLIWLPITPPTTAPPIVPPTLPSVSAAPARRPSRRRSRYCARASTCCRTRSGSPPRTPRNRLLQHRSLRAVHKQ